MAKRSDGVQVWASANKPFWTMKRVASDLSEAVIG